MTETKKRTLKWEVLALDVSLHSLSPYRTAFNELGVTPSEEQRSFPTNPCPCSWTTRMSAEPTKTGKLV